MFKYQWETLLKICKSMLSPLHVSRVVLLHPLRSAITYSTMCLLKNCNFTENVQMYVISTILITSLSLIKVQSIQWPPGARHFIQCSPQPSLTSLHVMPFASAHCVQHPLPHVFCLNKRKSWLVFELI